MTTFDRAFQLQQASMADRPPPVAPETRLKRAEPAGKPGSVVDSHSSRRRVAAALEQPTRSRRGPRHEDPIWPCSRWGLPCRPVARLAVRSYRTISPLPSIAPASREPWAVSFCCTFRRLAPPRRYLAPCPVEPGLSSASARDDATVWPTPPLPAYRGQGAEDRICCPSPVNSRQPGHRSDPMKTTVYR